MHPNAELISNFYAAFAAGDHLTMEGSYSDQATFGDPVFPHLDAELVRAMWRMFCTSGNDITVTFTDIVADDTTGSAHWDAVYAFPKTGRAVHNHIDARFTFAGGLITTHRDTFDLYAWTRMALGPIGMLLGWTPMIQGQVRKQARSQLNRFMAGGSKPA